MSPSLPALVLALALLAEAGAADPPDSRPEVVAQETAVWCWAASAQMAARRLLEPAEHHTQGRQVQAYLGLDTRCEADCEKGTALPPGCNVTGKPDFKYLGLRAAPLENDHEKGVTGLRLEWSALERELRCRPILFAYSMGESGHMVMLNSAVSRHRAGSRTGVPAEPERWLEVHDPEVRSYDGTRCLADRKVIPYGVYLKWTPWRTYHQIHRAEEAYEPCPPGPTSGFDPPGALFESSISHESPSELDSFLFGEPVDFTPPAPTPHEAVEGFLPTLVVNQSLFYAQDATVGADGFPGFFAGYDGTLWLRDAAGLEPDSALECGVERPIRQETLTVDRLRESDGELLDSLVHDEARVRFVCEESGDAWFSIEVSRADDQWKVASMGNRHLARAIEEGLRFASEGETLHEVFVPGLNLRFLRFRASDGTSWVVPLSPQLDVALDLEDGRVAEAVVLRDLRQRAVHYQPPSFD